MKWLKKIKITRLIFLIVLLAGNTFAWFIYTSKIDGTIKVHVKAWDVVFESSDTEIASNVVINVNDLYPGMDNYEHTIRAYNKSEVSASLTYKLLEARILDETYVTVDGRIEKNEEPQEGDLTTQELINKLANDYPFSIESSVSSETINADNGASDYTISVIWPYESNNDELDTQWGIAAATYKANNPTSSSISLLIKLFITQNPDVTSPDPPSSSSNQEPSSNP